MKLSAAALVLAAALGASAHPSGHAHRFLHRRAIGSSSNFFMSTRPDRSVDKAVEGSDPAPAPDSVPAPTNPAPEVPPSPGGDIPPVPKSSEPGPSGSDSTHDNGLGASTEEPFCKKKSRRATQAQIARKGYRGEQGDYGCNLKLIQAPVFEKYSHTLTLNNVLNKDQQCVCWNKADEAGDINGFWKGKEVLKFNLGSKMSQSVAIHEDSMGGCSCDVGQLQTTALGQWAGTWVEFDMASAANNRWSGADASCLVAATEHLNIPGMKVYRANGSEPPSVICPGGTGGTNAYVDGTKDLDGIGLNIQGDKIRLVADVGHKC